MPEGIHIRKSQVKGYESSEFVRFLCWLQSGRIAHCRETYLFMQQCRQLFSDRKSVPLIMGEVLAQKSIAGFQRTPRDQNADHNMFNIFNTGSVQRCKHMHHGTPIPVPLYTQQ